MTKTILLADDSVTIQKVVELTFMDEDFRVSAVSQRRGGDRAAERVEAGRGHRRRAHARSRRIRGLPALEGALSRGSRAAAGRHVRGLRRRRGDALRRRRSPEEAVRLPGADAARARALPRRRRAPCRSRRRRRFAGEAVGSAPEPDADDIYAAGAGRARSGSRSPRICRRSSCAPEAAGRSGARVDSAAVRAGGDVHPLRADAAAPEPAATPAGASRPSRPLPPTARRRRRPSPAPRSPTPTSIGSRAACSSWSATRRCATSPGRSYPTSPRCC